MKKKNFFAVVLSSLFMCSGVWAQDTTYFQLGQGVNLSLNEGDYLFSFGGNMKSDYTYLYDTSQLISGRHGFELQRAQFSLLGKAKQEKMTFFILADFVNTWALLEAWVGFDLANEKLFIAAGQKLVNTNNRELNKHQNFFQFVQPSLVSTRFAGLGREFGLFLDGKFAVADVVLKPSIAITSGDGLNSFGSGTTDRFDYGGAKFGGRVEILPLGEFSDGNDFLGSDLAFESAPRVSLGGSFTTNQGASHPVGEGHGYFLFYSQIQPDGSFRTAYPNYQKIYADLIFKYSGFNLGLEYVNAFGSEIKGLFTDTNASNQTPIYSGDIAKFLALGSGMNVQAGYLFKNLWALDVRYSSISPEFKNESASVLTEQEAYTVGVSKFLKGQAMKVQVNADFLNSKQRVNTTLVEKGEIRGSIALQVIF